MKYLIIGIIFLTSCSKSLDTIPLKETLQEEGLLPAPYGVAIGECVSEGHPGLHGRLWYLEAGNIEVHYDLRLLNSMMAYGSVCPDCYISQLRIRDQIRINLR